MIKILESIVYILSNIFLIYGFIRLKKSKEKLNIIHWIFISFILLFCYNSLIALVLSTFSIPVYLISVTLCNVGIGILLITRKQKQEYFLEKKDVVATIIFAVITIIIMILRFGIPFRIAYETCDPGVHFWTAKDFYEQSYLLNKVSDKTTVNFETRQAASYTNVGLMFKVASPFINEFDLYKVYILYDIFMLFMSAMIFYILISNTKSKGKYILSIIITILYFNGYPLNNMIFGFFYSGHAITIIATLLCLMKYYYNEKFNNNIKNILLSLTCFGLFFTYYFYAPVVFLGIFLYITYNDIKNKNKIISKEYVIKNLCIFLPACLLGFLYYILPNIGDPNTSISTQINLDGYFYNNIYSNFILLIPIVVLSYAYCIKQKNMEVEHFILTFLLLFMATILLLIIQDKAVGYYLSKNYYLLWLMCFAIMGKFLVEKYDKNKMFVITYTAFNILIIGLTLLDFEQKIIDLEEWEINKTEASNLFYVYKFNYNLILNKEPDFDANQLKMLKKIYNMKVTNLKNNSSYGFVDRHSWLAAWFMKKPVTEITENKLFTYIAEKNYIEIMPVYKTLSEFNVKEINYNIININDNNWFLFIYSKEVKDPLVDEEVGNVIVIEGKENYDKVDRKTCENCTFYDFDEGLLIYKAQER